MLCGKEEKSSSGGSSKPVCELRVVVGVGVPWIAIAINNFGIGYY